MPVRSGRAVLPLVCLSLAVTLGDGGCAGGGIQNLLSGLVNLTGLGGALGGLGTGGGRGPAAPEGPNRIPSPGAGSAPPSGSNQRAQVPSGDVAQLVKELQDQHGITVRGNYTQQDLQYCLMSARDFKPEDTANLDITYTGDNIDSGVLGVTSSDGECEIYSSIPDVIHHEMTHHVTIYEGNPRGQQMGDQLVQTAEQAGGGQIPDSCITRDYATTNDAEFIAEFETGLAGMERGYPLEFTYENGAWGPPESVKAAGRALFSQ